MIAQYQSQTKNIACMYVMRLNEVIYLNVIFFFTTDIYFNTADSFDE